MATYRDLAFSDLYGTELDLELGSSDRSQLFTTTRRQAAVNDAMHAFEIDTRCTVIQGTIAIPDGQAEYNLFTYFANFISLEDKRYPSIKRVNSSGTVTWIEGNENFMFRSPSWNDREIPGWRADAKGTPVNFYFRDDAGTTYLGLNPAPNPAAFSETWTLYVPYLAASDDMSSDTDKPFTVSGTVLVRLRPYRRALVHYAASLLEKGRKNYTVAQQQEAQYAKYVARYLAKVQKEQPDDVIFGRNYFREAGKPIRAVDPHRFP